MHRPAVHYTQMFIKNVVQNLNFVFNYSETCIFQGNKMTRTCFEQTSLSFSFCWNICHTIWTWLFSSRGISQCKTALLRSDNFPFVGHSRWYIRAEKSAIVTSVVLTECLVTSMSSACLSHCLSFPVSISPSGLKIDSSWLLHYALLSISLVCIPRSIWIFRSFRPDSRAGAHKSTSTGQFTPGIMQFCHIECFSFNHT